MVYSVFLLYLYSASAAEAAAAQFRNDGRYKRPYLVGTYQTTRKSWPFTGLEEFIFFSIKFQEYSHNSRRLNHIIQCTQTEPTTSSLDNGWRCDDTSTLIVDKSVHVSPWALFPKHRMAYILCRWLPLLR